MTQEFEVIKGTESKGSVNNFSNTTPLWRLKFAICVIYDLIDMTAGRLMPFVGEVVGVALCCAMFGKNGLFYGLEVIDITEQIDGFIPTATIIAWNNKEYL